MRIASRTLSSGTGSPNTTRPSSLKPSRAHRPGTSIVFVTQDAIAALPPSPLAEGERPVETLVPDEGVARAQRTAFVGHEGFDGALAFSQRARRQRRDRILGDEHD